MDLLLRGSLPGYLQYSMAESSAMHPGTFVGPEMDQGGGCERRTRVQVMGTRKECTQEK